MFKTLQIVIHENNNTVTTSPTRLSIQIDIQSVREKNAPKTILLQTTKFHAPPTIIYMQVFQRRDDGSVDFYRGWDEYKNGFGNIGGEFWLGNQYLYRITTQDRYELRIDMEDFDGEHRYAYYDNFEIGGEGADFKLIVGTYEGDAGKYFL